MENNTDTIYINRILDGDTGAFKFLVEKYQKMVYTLALKITGNNEEAEDAAQEIFVKCYRALSSYNNRASFATWLYRITYNHAIDTLKKNNRISYIEKRDGAAEQAEIEHHSFDEKIDLKDVRVLLKDAIHRLSVHDQVIVTLYYYDGLPLRDIAEIMGIRENNIKIKLYRIRSKLQALLQSKNEIISILNL
ncbi:MAG: RNA polymerase sigma factor [Ginsengibacter sp.]